MRSKLGVLRAEIREHSKSLTDQSAQYFQTHEVYCQSEETLFEELSYVSDLRDNNRLLFELTRCVISTSETVVGIEAIVNH
jgi:hypothetical protein